MKHDPNHKWDTCACGNPKTATSKCCQACHIKRLARLRSVRARARALMERYLLGATLVLVPSKEMSDDEFVSAIEAIVS